MTGAVAVCGWGVAALAGALALIAWRRLAVRMELMARGCHELRGPLTAARLGLELGGRAEGLSAARLRALDLELARAALVLEDMSAGATCAPRSLRSEEIDVEELLRDSAEAWRASAAARQVALEVRWYGESAHVGGERLRLAQATGNLIANAIEHGGEGVAVCGRAEHGVVRIEVIDRGPGLPAPVSELIRRPRAGRGRRGRGLAIATAVAEAHGGRLASAPTDGGARIVLELPARGGAPARAPVAG